MRTGLLAIGLVIAIVGAGVTVSGFLIPNGVTSTQVRFSSVYAPNITFAQTRTAAIPMANTSSGSLDFSWSANYALAVAIYQGEPCSAASHFCPSGPALVSWASNTSGSWNHTGQLTYPYLLSMKNVQVTDVTLRGTVAESIYVQTKALPTWALVVILAGGVILVAIGSLAVFLGLFLRRGVYSEPEAVTPRYAHELARPGDPLDEPFDDGPGVGGYRPPGH